MEIYYLNSENRKIELSEFPIALEDVTELFAKEWEFDVTEIKSKNSSRLSLFFRTSVKKKLKISIYADSEEEYTHCMNEFEEITEIDVLKKEQGRLYCNGYYIECFIVAENPADYDADFYTIDSEITVVSFYPFWVREETFTIKAQEISTTNNKNYPGKYPYRYANGLSNMYIFNRHFQDANFLIRMYGPVINPQVIIGGYIYLVNIILEAGEYLEMDSRSGTVVKTMINGTKVNAFHNRKKQQGSFRKIPPGRQTIIWSGKFDFDIIVYEERSKPKW